MQKILRIRFISRIFRNTIVDIMLYAKVQGTESYWECQPTRTLNGGPFSDVNELVRQLIKEGFKKIIIMDCNPGHHKLVDDIMKTKGVLINHSDFSNWVESGELYSNDTSLQYLIEAENDLRSLALEYDIDYNDDSYIEECMKWYIDNQEIIQEGVWDTIKEFGKKVITAIIGFFKKIINYIRLAISKVKELLFGSKEKPKNVKAKTPDIKVKLIDLDAKNIKEFTAKCRYDLNDIWEKTASTISKEIKKQSDTQNKLSKALERDLNRINPSSTKESSNMVDNTLIHKYSWLFGNVLDEANLPGVEDDNDDTDDDYTVSDSNDTDTQDTEPVGDTDTQNVDTGDTPDEPDDDYDVPDSDTTDTETTDAGEGDNQEAGEGDPDTGDDDYTLPDAGEGGDDTGEEGDDDEGDDNFDVPDAREGGDDTGEEGDTGEDTGTDDTGDSDLGGDDTGEDVSDDVQIPNLREVQKQLFDQLTPEQQAIKVKELKNNYAELYTRCANILKAITDSNPGDENMVRVFDYVQKTMTDLQTHIYYYITNTFDTKTYMENDMQFKQFLTILNTIKNILDELNGEKKE